MAADAQAPRLAVHGNEQQADIGVNDDVAETLEHAIPVIVRECDLGRSRHPDKARGTALERAIRSPFGIGCRQEEIRQGFDEQPVLWREFLVRELLFQPIRNAAAVEPILQLSISLVIHHARRHACLLLWMSYEFLRVRGQPGPEFAAKHSTLLSHRIQQEAADAAALWKPEVAGDAVSVDA